MTWSIEAEVCRNAVRGGLSHGHTGNMYKKFVKLCHVFLAICRPAGCTVLSGVVVVVIVVVGDCNRSQMRTSKYTCLIFGVSTGLDPG